MLINMGGKQADMVGRMLPRSVATSNSAARLLATPAWARARCTLMPSGLTGLSLRDELGLLQAHRYVLGPIFWFVVMGPVGPVVYRAADLLAERWGKQMEPEKRIFALFAERAFFWIDWLPARVTAASFAIAGNFEDAAYCWRTQAAAWNRNAEGVVLASGAGEFSGTSITRKPASSSTWATSSTVSGVTPRRIATTGWASKRCSGALIRPPRADRPRRPAATGPGWWRRHWRG